MSEVLRPLPFSIIERPSSGSYVAFPNAREPRWLLPQGLFLRRHGLKMYQPQRLGGRLRRFLISNALYKGDRVDIAEAAALEGLFEGALGSEVRLAFQLGVPGAYQKVVVQAMSPDGSVLAYGKLALGPSAFAALANERSTLERLSQEPLLKGSIPEVLAWHYWQQHAILLTSPGPAAPGPRQFGKAHNIFLDRIYRAFGKTSKFCECPMWTSMTTRYATIRDHLPLVWRTRYDQVFDQIHSELGDAVVPLTVAHRDFTPWNTRLRPSGTLFVFDWEFSHEGYLRDYDRFQFELMDTLLLGSRSAAVSEALQRTRSAHYLAFLTDLALLYHQAQVAMAIREDDLVLRTMSHILDQMAGK